jgi:hypothetical protein
MYQYQFSLGDDITSEVAGYMDRIRVTETREKKCDDWVWTTPEILKWNDWGLDDPNCFTTDVKDKESEDGLTRWSEFSTWRGDCFSTLVATTADSSKSAIWSFRSLSKDKKTWTRQCPD